VKTVEYVGTAIGQGPLYCCKKCNHVWPAPGVANPDCPQCLMPPPESDQGRQLKWDRIFLQEAKSWGLACSKDPSTKCGAVIVGPKGDIVSKGYNGFARKVKDEPARYLDRDTKLGLIVHCEVNAILFADRWRLEGATLYTWPFQCCSNCASVVVQAGITRCVAPPTSDDINGRWGESIRWARTQFVEAGVRLDIVEMN
jgi:dCMP deaminase